MERPPSPTFVARINDLFAEQAVCRRSLPAPPGFTKPGFEPVTPERIEWHPRRKGEVRYGGRG
jgi:hypothetical protein